MKIWLILGNLWNSFRPCRGLIFLNQFLSWKVEMILRFRPLSGTYISQYNKSCWIHHCQRFRPLSGTYISQWSDSMQHRPRDWFPSPVGDLYFSMAKYYRQTFMAVVSVPCRGLIFLNIKGGIPMYTDFEFPSPVGDLYFSMYRSVIRHEAQKAVSVPCRGLIFLNVT